VISPVHAIKEEAARLGFLLAGITTPDPPPHGQAYEHWLSAGRNGAMAYLADQRARARRADPRQIMPDCKSILMLGIPYADPNSTAPVNVDSPHGRVAAYAWGADYHLVLPGRLQTLVKFIEAQAGRPVSNRWYTDTGPILERDLAQRAGLGWIGKNTCLISPTHGSYFLLAEIFLDLELPIDQPIDTDHCGTCTRCIDACPTKCILPDRTLDARRCISYLTIENKADIPADLRPSIGNWVFGCDVCQSACPWNRFAGEGDPAFAPRTGVPQPDLIQELALTPPGFNRKFKDSPVQRAKRRGYLRNVAVALGNSKNTNALPVLEQVFQDREPLISESARLSHNQLSHI
jgi:epoxyqueuosine reductase